MRYGTKPWISLGISIGLAIFASVGFYFVVDRDFGSAVLVGTAILIAWYSLETNLLRRATEATIEIEQTPFITLNVHEDNRRMFLTLENVGKTIARYIRFTPFAIGDMNYLLHLDGANDFLYPANSGQGRVALKLIARRRNRSTLLESQFDDLYRHISSTAPIFIIANYRNPVGAKFYSVYRLSARLPIVFSPMLEFVAAGKGEINLARAESEAQALDRTHPSVVLDAFISQEHPDAPA